MYSFYRNFQQINNKGDKRKIVQSYKIIITLEIQFYPGF